MAIVYWFYVEYIIYILAYSPYYSIPAYPKDVIKWKCGQTLGLELGQLRYCSSNY